MKNKLNLASEVILNKKFETELSGYNATEVDKYLDMIIEDYSVFQEELKVFNKKTEEKMSLIAQRDEEIATLKLKIKNLETQLKEASKITNYEIAKKIERLEEKLSSKD